ncbi:hypothetical protein KA043_03980 [Candidatus Saccharibacteria bacterium]|jgi:FMN phosphatase YigB (HAD superfamily)|nr:hypothetical protein [Candidatus Saccharibacteria bacterium]
MKTILVDAIDGIVLKDGTLFKGMYAMLETFPNKKIVLTSANDEQSKQYNLHKLPYEIFTLKHDPEKSDPKYFKIMLDNFNLKSSDVIYFEHDPLAVKCAEKVGIKTYYYDPIEKDLNSLKAFIISNL